MKCERHTHRGLTYGRVLVCYDHHGNNECVRCGAIPLRTRNGATPNVVHTTWVPR